MTGSPGHAGVPDGDLGSERSALSRHPGSQQDEPGCGLRGGSWSPAPLLGAYCCRSPGLEERGRARLPGLVALTSEQLVLARVAHRSGRGARLDSIGLDEVTGLSTAYLEAGFTARQLNGSVGHLIRDAGEDVVVAVHTRRGDLIVGFGEHQVVASSFEHALGQALMEPTDEDEEASLARLQPSSTTLTDDLVRLAELRQQGLLDDDEFKQAKAQLLNGVR